jgi:CubicO group peptidase (beta-lactamase class C family)
MSSSKRIPLRVKKILKALLLILIIGLAYGTWYAWRAFPVISGYGAKNLASAVFLQHRKPEDVIKEDLGSFPLSIGTYTVNLEDSSVTGSVWGFAKKKAIYRTGAGCTLINDFTEEEIRKQQFNRPAKPAVNTDTIPWPVGDKLPDTLPTVVNKALLEKAVTNVFADPFEGKQPVTRAVLIIYNGQIVTERYAPGFDKNTVMLGWSMSKSLGATLVGLLVNQGKLKVDAPAPVPEWKGTKKEKITLKHLLQQTSGLDFDEDYESPSEATNMLYKHGDMAAFTAELPLKHEPGTVFNYSSGNSNLLSRIVRHTVKPEDYPAFPYHELFYKINAYSFLLEPDASGTYIGSSYSYATARDFARFGLLYYNRGVWNGEQVLPADWVKDASAPPEANKQKNYGYQFWMNGFTEKDLTQPRYPDVPQDMFFANGYGGQHIFIIPSKKLVVVRLGLNPIDRNKFLKEVIEAVK